MIDFTKNIKLTGSWHKKYLIAKSMTYVLFAIFALFTLYKILFPTFYFDYYFNIKDAKKNNMLNPTTESGVLLENDFDTEGGIFIFDTSVLGNFSNAKISFSTKDSSDTPNNSQFIIQKAYQAFTYPTGNPLGFNNGSLLFSDEKYYMISNGKLRKFSNFEVAKTMGFEKNMFEKVNTEELKYTPMGDAILGESYPDYTNIKIDETYYQLQNGKLFAFVSEKAFLTKFNTNQAITKEFSFLENYKLSEDPIGFADGSLVSSPQSVFFLTDNKSYPFNNILTFESKGFSWEDILPATSDEIGIYERQKIFDIRQPHPDGTVFLDVATKSYYIIRNGRKYPLPSEAIAKSYLKKNPILINSTDSDKKLFCQAKKVFLSFNKYACNLNISEFNNITGSNYHFKAMLGEDVKPAELHVTLKKSFKLTSLKESLAEIKQKLIQNYYGEQAQ